MKLKEFNAKVKSLPFYVTFEEAWDKHGLVEFFFTTSENKEEIHQLFRKARFPHCPSWSQSTTITTIITTVPTFKTLYKIEDPGQFSIPCQVNGHYFDRTLCDSGSCINLMPTQTAKLLGITRLQPAQISIGLANHTIAKPRGVVVDVLLEIGDIKIPVDFHVINIQGGCDTPLILGRPFLATAGAVMDLPNRRMSLANVTRQSFTRPYHSSHQTSCLTSSLPKAAQESHQTTLKESKNHTMVKKIYHKKNVHSWRDLDGRAEPLHARPCPLKPPNTPSHLIPSASHPSHLTTLAFHHYHHSTAFTILQKRSYSQKSEDCSRRPIENQRPNACSALGQNRIRPTEVSAKVPNRPADHAHDPGNIVPRSAKPTFHATPRTTSRASRETSLAAAQPSRTTADASVRAGKNVPRPAEKPSAKSSSVRPRRPTMKHPATTVPTRPRPDCPADRPDRPSERRGRPEAVFEAQSAQFKPKAGADLARLGLAAFYT
ncbi:unnamed protein product [Microthlaspi erraticum]|uniref:Aspartic peptidase DDI1-type domain-containing protein n=1 Tax=Microthlaspi erraticum TaxID=1685480 RepID=A0A6D2L291_9BRAS|nr:unnamed protein product [Microthlaspi erraticum]